jgi:VWFA-related protein
MWVVLPISMTSGFRLFLTGALVLLVALGSPFAAHAQSLDQFETIRVETDLVNLNVSVFSRAVVRKAPALAQKDFAVFENGIPQEISFFASADTPFDLVLLVDLSGSTANKLDVIRKSCKHFVDAARPNDRVAILTFSTEVRAVSMFSTDREGLKKGVSKIEKPKGGTNLWDALRFVFEHVLDQSRHDNRRSAVVLMTDGIDNALPDVPGEGSATSFEDLMKIIAASDSIVLPIYLDSEKETISMRQATPQTFALARKYLSNLADETGGNVVYRARKVDDLNGIYEQVIRDLSTVYSIGYRPNDRVRDGSWRGVSVQLQAHPDLWRGQKEDISRNSGRSSAGMQWTVNSGGIIPALKDVRTLLPRKSFDHEKFHSYI